ncbi:MAG TPA: hypothetical protein VIC87_14665 [Vicinamibacteria bacterium]
MDTLKEERGRRDRDLIVTEAEAREGAILVAAVAADMAGRRPR